VAVRGLDRRLSSVADVLVAVDARPNLAGAVLERAEHWRVRPLVERAAREAYAAAELEVPLTWATAMRRPTRRRDRFVEAAYLSDVPRPALRELAYLRVMKGWRARWRYTTGYFKTDADYVALYGRSGPRAQWKYVRSKLR
jgi:hypothetical protein